MLTTIKHGEKITILGNADDVTGFAARKAQAIAMLYEVTAGLGGVNLKLLPENAVRSGTWRGMDPRHRK